MSLDLAEKIARTLLYEGYMLYPYRPSSVKNQQRFNFGVLFPESCDSAREAAEASSMQTECLVRGNPDTSVEVRIHFLHLLAREVQQSATTDTAVAEEEPSNRWQSVDSLEVAGRSYQTWQEAIEREVVIKFSHLRELITVPIRQCFRFEASYDEELLTHADSKVAGRLVRRQEVLEGVAGISTVEVASGLFRLTVRIQNESQATSNGRERDRALMQSFVSTHTIVRISDGEFVSLLDPPEDLQPEVEKCRNIGTWPVLAGEPGDRDLMLSSPIILYDYPEVAPESAGDLCDGTEIDEILTLRILTLTDAEKREMRDSDDRARRILERTEALPVEQFMKLHGAVRGLRPVKARSRRSDE